MPNNRKPQRKVEEGTSALKRIIKNSRDQAVDAVKQRYVRGGLAQVKSDVQALKRLLNTEEKHIDTLTGATTVTSGSSLISSIGTMAEGSDSNQRTGRSVKIIRTDLLMSFQYSTGAPGTQAFQNQVFNWYLVKYNKTTSNAAFSIADLLNQDPGSNYTAISLPNPDLNQNFTILDAGVVDVDLTEATTVTSARVVIKQVTVNRSFHQIYSSTTAASITDNMCFLVFTAFQPINTGGLSQIAYSARMWYVDN